MTTQARYDGWTIVVALIIFSIIARLGYQFRADDDRGGVILMIVCGTVVAIVIAMCVYTFVGEVRQGGDDAGE